MKDGCASCGRTHDCPHSDAIYAGVAPSPSPACPQPAGESFGRASIPIPGQDARPAFSEVRV